MSDAAVRPVRKHAVAVLLMVILLAAPRLSAAGMAPMCGNGITEGDEECDGLDLDDNTCEDLCDEPDPPGTLACRPNCRFDFRGCRGTDCEAF